MRRKKKIKAILLAISAMVLFNEYQASSQEPQRANQDDHCNDQNEPKKEEKNRNETTKEVKNRNIAAEKTNTKVTRKYSEYLINYLRRTTEAWQKAKRKKLRERIEQVEQVEELMKKRIEEERKRQTEKKTVNERWIDTTNQEGQNKKIPIHDEQKYTHYLWKALTLLERVNDMKNSQNEPVSRKHLRPTIKQKTPTPTNVPAEPTNEIETNLNDRKQMPKTEDPSEPKMTPKTQLPNKLEAIEKELTQSDEHQVLEDKCWMKSPDTKQNQSKKENKERKKVATQEKNEKRLEKDQTKNGTPRREMHHPRKREKKLTPRELYMQCGRVAVVVRRDEYNILNMEIGGGQKGGFLINIDGELLVICPAHENKNEYRVRQQVYAIALRETTFYAPLKVTRLEIEEVYEDRIRDIKVYRVCSRYEGPTAKAAQKAPKAGEPVYVMGQPNLEYWSVRNEHVVRENFCDVGGMLITGTHIAGCCGSTVFNQSGEVIGIQPKGSNPTATVYTIAGITELMRKNRASKREEKDETTLKLDGKNNGGGCLVF